jgi:hypothetical protein
MAAEPDESNWRITMGFGLLEHCPLSPERKEIIRREAEREARAAEFEAEQRRTAALERRWELERQGITAHSHEDVLARMSYGADRTDRIEARREKEAAEQLGQPEPRINRWELKREQQQREAEALITPASKADVSKLSQSITSLASKVGLLGRRRSEQLETPEEYARNYGDGYHSPRNYVRNTGGHILRGPY